MVPNHSSAVATPVFVQPSAVTEAKAPALPPVTPSRAAAVGQASSGVLTPALVQPPAVTASSDSKAPPLPPVARHAPVAVAVAVAPRMTPKSAQALAVG